MRAGGKKIEEKQNFISFSGKFNDGDQFLAKIMGAMKKTNKIKT